MSAQAQMRALLDQLMGTARDGELLLMLAELAKMEPLLRLVLVVWWQTCMDGCGTAAGCVEYSRFTV